MTRPVRACVSPGRAERRPAGARVGHLRTRGGEYKVDLIVEHGEHSAVAVEVKLGPAPSDRDARHLNWLAQGLGSRLIDRVIINTHMFAYRRAPVRALAQAAPGNPCATPRRSVQVRITPPHLIQG